MNLPAIPSLLQFSQAAVYRAIKDCAASPGLPALIALDATCGNGHDTLFLAKSLREAHAGKDHLVISLDVQQQAMENTRKLLAENLLADNVLLLLQSHEALESILGNMQNNYEAPARLCVGMYNLGYLPGSDKKIKTCKRSTLVSLCAVGERLAAGGLLSIHAYGGHPGGLEELEALDDWSSKLEPEAWSVARYCIHNKRTRPEVLFLLRKRAA